MSDVVALQVLPGREGFFGGDGPRAQPFEFLQRDLRVGGEAESPPDHPVQADGVAALPVTRPGQAVEVGVGRRVGALPRDTEHRPGRGSHEQEVEAARREDLVQRLRTGDFRRHGVPKTALGDLGQELGVGDSGGVDDTAYRRGSIGVPLGKKRLHRVARTHVEGHGIDRDPAQFQRPDGGDLLPACRRRRCRCPSRAVVAAECGRPVSDDARRDPRANRPSADRAHPYRR